MIYGGLLAICQMGNQLLQRDGSVGPEHYGQIVHTYIEDAGLLELVWQVQAPVAMTMEVVRAPVHLVPTQEGEVAQAHPDHLSIVEFVVLLMVRLDLGEGRGLLEHLHAVMVALDQELLAVETTQQVLRFMPVVKTEVTQDKHAVGVVHSAVPLPDEVLLHLDHVTERTVAMLDHIRVPEVRISDEEIPNLCN